MTDRKFSIGDETTQLLFRGTEYFGVITGVYAVSRENPSVELAIAGGLIYLTAHLGNRIKERVLNTLENKTDNNQ